MKPAFKKSKARRVALRLLAFGIVSLLLVGASLKRPGPADRAGMISLAARARSQLVGVWRQQLAQFDVNTLLTQFEYVFCTGTGAGARVECAT